jgi:uncharacterized RDD family membrane protein YckC
VPPFASAEPLGYLRLVEQGTHNPYRAPDTDLQSEDVAAGSLPFVLASRGSRLGASFIDGLLALGILLPMQYAAGLYDSFPQATKLTPVQTVLWSAAGLVLFVLLHGYFLKKNGQTIGKRLLRIRIASAADGSTPPLDRLLLWRVLPVQVVVLIPYVGMLVMLVDALLIFRPDQRCLHDHIARTIVLKVA